MVILCDIENNYYDTFDNTDETIEELLNLIEEKEMKFLYDEAFNVIKVISQEQYDMYIQKNELNTFFNNEEINTTIENNEIMEDNLQVKKCEKTEKLTRKELNKMYRDTHKVYFKKYVNENKQHIRELKSNLYIKNKEELKEKAKVYRETHKEELKNKRKEYKERNKEKIKLYNKKYFDCKKQVKIKELEDIEKKKNERKEYYKKYYENRKKLKH